MKMVIEFEGEGDKTLAQITRALLFIGGAVRAATIGGPLDREGFHLSNHIEMFVKAMVRSGADSSR